MMEIYKIVNSVAAPIMNSLFEFRINKDNIRSFQVLSTDVIKTVNYGIEPTTYTYVYIGLPSLLEKLPSQYKLAASLEEFRVKFKK